MTSNEKGSPSVDGRSSEKLPSYEDVRAERNLKDTFAKLVKDHEDIQKLFLSVSAQLETTPKIGEGHELCKEWNGLRQKHRKLYRDSQLNASQCSSFLKNFSSVLVPLSKSKMTLQEKTLMINKFLEAIPTHQEAARKTAVKFHELGKQVGVFPLKVSSYLRNEADSGGFWYNLWSGVEDLCMSIWNALHSLLAAIVNTFRSMLACIDTIRFSCTPLLYMELEMNIASQAQSTSPEGTASSLGQATRDVNEISQRLSGFEDAWHVVRLLCDTLLQNVSMANAVSSIPAAFEANLKNAESVYAPLVQCLLAYATGKPPTL